MEVHHHAHTARKKWTHYFWEFLMLFLAVFCGFLAEYTLEHKIEKAREKLKKEVTIKFTKPKFDWSVYGGWVNAHEPVNKGRLGSTQEWKKEKPFPIYY